MEVMRGYKQTEAGVIPESWRVATLLVLSRQIMDFRGRTPRKLGMEWGEGDIPALSAGNVKKGFIDLSEECYFASQDLYKKWMTRGDVAKDDILFTTEAPLGNVALIPDNQKYILSQRTILLQINPQLASSGFLFQVLRSDQFQRTLADYASGSTAKGIQRKKLEQLCVPVPSLPEQRAIANALSDMDALLGGLDRVIAKKRDLKQAAMQQLLTGRTRLPGFSAAWEVKRLGELGPFLKGSGVKKDEAKSGTLPCVRYGEIYTDHNDVVRHFRSWITPAVAQKATRLRKGDLLFAASGETKEEIGKCVAFVDDCEAYAGGDIVILRPRGVDPRFMGYYLNTKPISLQKSSKGQGDAVVHLSATALYGIQIEVPTREEQAVIATILSDMDDELAALEARVEKTRALQQAMMQELLTGRIRLVTSYHAHA